MHFYRNVFTVVPRGKVKAVATMLKAIHAQEDVREARKKSKTIVAKLEALKLKRAAEIVPDFNIGALEPPLKFQQSMGLRLKIRSIRRSTFHAEQQLCPRLVRFRGRIVGLLVA